MLYASCTCSQFKVLIINKVYLLLLLYSRCIYAQMWSKYDIYFTFASFLIPPQINTFDIHLNIFALFAKYCVCSRHKVEANMVQSLQIRTFALVLLLFCYRSKYAPEQYFCITTKPTDLRVLPRDILGWGGAARPLIPWPCLTNITDFSTLFKTELRFLIPCLRHLKLQLQEVWLSFCVSNGNLMCLVSLPIRQSQQKSILITKSL